MIYMKMVPVEYYFLARNPHETKMVMMCLLFLNEGDGRRILVSWILRGILVHRIGSQMV